MIKRMFSLSSKIGYAVAAIALALTLGVATATADFDGDPDFVEFDRISVHSEQMLMDSGFLDKTAYGTCSGWNCLGGCGQGCFCKGGECLG